jgi:hypothetical protein
LLRLLKNSILGGVKGCISCVTFGVLAVIVILIVAAIIVAVAHKSSTPIKPADVTSRVTGTFQRNCFACGDLAAKITTTDVYCGWDGNRVAVHVTMRDRSSESATVNWHPSYRIMNGASHGTGLTSIQETKLKPAQARSVFAAEYPHGVTAGTAIARCYPSFFTVKSG